MLKKFFLFIFFVVMIVAINAQSHVDRQTSALIDSVSYYINEIEFDQLQRFCDSLDRRSVELNDSLVFCWSRFLLSSKLAKAGNMNEAFSELENAKAICFNNKDEYWKSLYRQNLAYVLFHQMEELIYTTEDLSQASVINDSIRSYHARSMNPEFLVRDTITYCRSLMIQIMSLQWTGDDEEAMEYLDELERLVKEAKLDNYDTTVLNLRAILLDRLGRTREAQMLYEYALEQQRKTNNHVEIASIAYNLGDLYYEQNEFSKALEVYLESYESGKYADISPEDESIGAQRIKETYQALGDFENALKWVEVEHEHFKEMETAELRLRFEKMQIETANFENEKLAFEHAEARRLAEKESEKHRQNNLLMMFISTVIVIVLLGYFVFSRIKTKNKLLQHEKEVSELIRKQEISSMEAMISGQEGERKRLGRELHDHIGSMLSTLGMHFTAAFEKSTGRDVNDVPEASRVLELLDSTVGETRKLSHNLMTGVLSRFGLVSAIRDLCDQISETGKVNVLLNAIGMDVRLNTMQELNLYRITQELVSNALKHGNPSTIRINLVKKQSSVVLQVKDDGVGMTPEQFKNGNGAGFTNISGRVAALHGKLEFGEKQENGTLIRIIVPL